MKRVVAYVRISSQSQIDNTSIETQLDKIELHCKLHDIEIVKLFKEEGISAKNTERPSYTEMIDFVTNKENRIDGIIAYKGDRMHRSLKNLLIMIEDVLIPNNINFVSVTEQFDTSTAQGMLMVQMMGSFSEFERKIINERTKSGRIAKGKNELYVGGRVPYGYTLIDSDRLTLNYEEAEVIKEIFKLRTKGVSLSKIGKVVGMSKERVFHILRNQIYIGNYKYNGSVEKNKISFKVPHIVSNYIWNKANNIK